GLELNVVGSTSPDWYKTERVATRSSSTASACSIASARSSIDCPIVDWAAAAAAPSSSLRFSIGHSPGKDLRSYRRPPAPATGSRAGVISALGVALELVAIEVHLAEVARRVPLRFVIE